MEKENSIRPLPLKYATLEVNPPREVDAGGEVVWTKKERNILRRDHAKMRLMFLRRKQRKRTGQKSSIFAPGAVESEANARILLGRSKAGGLVVFSKLEGFGDGRPFEDDIASKTKSDVHFSLAADG